MISTFWASKKNALYPEPIQIDAAQYKPLSRGNKTDVVEKGYAIIVAVQNTGYQNAQLSQRI
jgi:hypothetical protein